jgi:IS30 family transposase
MTARFGSSGRKGIGLHLSAVHPLPEREAIRRRDLLDEPVREIARSYNVSHNTISRLVA